MACCESVGTAIAIVTATITRLLFAAHTFIAVWRVTITLCSQFYWYMLGLLVLLIVEYVVVMYVKKGKGWKWSVFVYVYSDTYLLE